MSRKCGDLFKAARLRAGLKRDPAAEELHIGVRTLDAYESTSEENEPDIEIEMLLEAAVAEFNAQRTAAAS